MPKAKGKSKSPGKKTPKSPKSPGSPKKEKKDKSKKGKKGKKPKEAPEEASEIEDSQIDESECTDAPESDEEVESEPDEELIEEWEESVNYIRRCWSMCGTPAELWQASHDEKVTAFLKDPGCPLITFYVETLPSPAPGSSTAPAEKQTDEPPSERTLVVLFGMPNRQVDEIIYFAKRPNSPPVLSDLNYRGKISWGNMKAPYLESLLIRMSSLYMPYFLGNTHWPDSIRKDFASKLHRFMAHLTDARYKAVGQTVLYVPDEDLSPPVEEMAKDKELVERLEAAMVHWIRQIKEMLSSLDSIEMPEKAGPLDEINFWNDRCKDLSGVKVQLDSPVVTRMSEVLQCAKSSYLSRFSRLAQEIQDGSEQAESNKHYLSILQEPCERLRKSGPAGIPGLLQDVLNRIRVIWNNSPFYNTRERVTGLLRRVSTEVINLCQRVISIEGIFSGRCRSSIHTLEECISCSLAWKNIYKRTARVHHQLSEQGWVLDITTIFAELDAFTQRCKDLIEICNCQMYLNRMEDGEQVPLPLFGGARGPDVTRNMREMERVFCAALNDLGTNRQIISDNRSTQWLNEFRKFRMRIKDVELMLSNIIDWSFETVRTVKEGVELLDCFRRYANRETIRRIFDMKTVQVFEIFADELQAVRRELSKKAFVLEPTYPYYAGQAHWAMSLVRRIQMPMEAISAAPWLPRIGIGDETKEQHRQLSVATTDFISKTHGDWASSVEPNPLQRLDQPLLTKSLERAGYIEPNFDRYLLKLFQEVYYWERLNMEIPPQCYDVFRRREEMRHLREAVGELCKDFNHIVASLSADERLLFRDRINFLSRKLAPGFSKLFWTGKGAAESFVKESRLGATKVQAIVNHYKLSNKLISEKCVSLAESWLINIDTNRVYTFDELQQSQADHRKSVVELLRSAQSEIMEILTNVFEHFRNDSQSVIQHWGKYLGRISIAVLESIKHNVRTSLTTLSKIVNVDSKSGSVALIGVKVLLKDNKIELEPGVSELAEFLCSYLQLLAGEFSSWRHIPGLLGHGDRNPPQAMDSILLTDEDSNKVQMAVNNGMAVTATQLQNYLKTWDSFRDIWEMDKDMFIKRYHRMNPTVAAFDSDIASDGQSRPESRGGERTVVLRNIGAQRVLKQYSEVANNVQMQDTIVGSQFTLLDSAGLKQSIVSHCTEWQQKLTQLLLRIASDRLTEVHRYVTDNTAGLKYEPQTLEELQTSINLHERLSREQPEQEASFPVMEEQFVVLEKYEVTVEDSVLDNLHRLPPVWEIYCALLAETTDTLETQKDRFRTGLLGDANDLKKGITNLIDDFRQKGPFTNAWDVEAARANITEYRNQATLLKEKDQVIKTGLKIFNMEHPLSKDLKRFETDLDAINSVWALTAEWEQSWNEWKGHRFQELDTIELDSQATSLHKRLTKQLKEYRDNGWDIIEQTKSQVDAFRKALPLIMDLKNVALRPRHWEEIRALIGREFSESTDLTMDNIFEWGMNQYSEEIHNISQSATKEMTIEKMLIKMKTTWDEMEMEILPYKEGRGLRCRVPDDLFQVLEDNQVGLQTMKASRFVEPFREEVKWWEKTLTVVYESIDAILSVQKQWMYMENIFLADDIRKQMPRETTDFGIIDNTWQSMLVVMKMDTLILRATHKKGLLKELSSMNVRLEEIQKRLDMYLETKRQAFPRFYFISNDDLLEILGQGKNPEAVQPHLKKLFDNLARVKIAKSAFHRLEASAMISGEGEEIDFSHPVSLDGPVEAWLSDLENAMQETLRNVLQKCIAALKKNLTKRDRWVKDWPGQLCITSSQIQWTVDTTRALLLVKDLGEKKPLKTFRKKMVNMLNKFSEAIRSNLTKLQRMKIVALVTIEVHARDVVEKLIKAGVNDVNSFEWLSQLRLYWDKDEEDCVVRQTNTQFYYGYEYLGNSGRLVITPLTDRCYMTLTSALHLHRGGSPKGPAGTGKTETVKDLGKAMAVFVIVLNCSEGLDYKSMGKMFSGLAQTGAWGCFDEFNRINIEVLSVVAQQILSILQALSTLSTQFVFEGNEIKLVNSCGIFITMNPGYAGRTELPDNLKSMFRPIAMVVPDSAMIAEIVLFGEGFSNTRNLARKVFTLYTLASRQLSKQSHYDFGLRGLIGLLRYAGIKKRMFPDMGDEEVVITAMNDMNLPKLTSDDSPLFAGIVSDLFPGVETPPLDYGQLYDVIRQQLKDNGLQATAYMVDKVIQLYETKNSRHSVMMVGQTGTSKTSIWRTLQWSLTEMASKEKEGYVPVKEYALNPKALNLGELYGEFDLGSGDWKDGVLSAIMRVTCADESPDQKWILFDGPVDAVWIENMNSVMDDNKVLTLINSERIALPAQVSLLFEVQDLDEASPATVSRAGMVYTDYKAIGWRPYVDSWLQTVHCKQTAEELRKLFDKFLGDMLEFKRKNCRELMPIVELNGVISLCRLLDCLCTKEFGVDPNDMDSFLTCAKLWFLFSMLWSVCASVDEEGRKKVDNYLRELEGSFPNKDTVYEYAVDHKHRSWSPWENKLQSNWKYNPNVPFYKILVPTVDTVRYDYILRTLIAHEFPAMLVGPVGTGKSSLASSVLAQLDVNKYTVLPVNMSAQTTSNNVQAIIESRMEKRTKNVYVPQGGKRLVVFLDDLNMPAKDTYGSQPPLELLRQWMQYGFWYDRNKQSSLYMQDVLLVGAMGPPGGGRSFISQRLQSKFNLVNMTFPQESQIKRIFGTLITQKLATFSEDVKPLGERVTTASIEMYQAVIANMLPTPAKIHYVFNLRDISKVFQGLLRSNRDYCDTKAAFVRLWIHECLRVFADRLIDTKDMEWFMGLMGEKLGLHFDQTFHGLCPSKQPPIFGDFLNTNEIYEDILDFASLKQYMENQLKEYNATPGVVSMNLVLFRDAISHICRTVRVLKLPRGNMLVVGIGGSGRQSLTRLAAYICGLSVFVIEVNKHYHRPEFREDLKVLYRATGLENKPTVFIFSDAQVTEETFLEDINNILSSGEVPNLYKPEELEEIRNTLQPVAARQGVPETPENLYGLLLDRVRSNLHLCVCMSPVGDAFRNRIRMYPGLVNCSTIDWFGEWPQEALMEVAERYLEGIDLNLGADTELLKDELQAAVAHTFSVIHRSVSNYSDRMLAEVRRHNYVTSTSYLQLVAGYKHLLGEKRKELGDAADKLRNGLFKIDETSVKVESMSVELEIAKGKVAEFQQQCEEYLVIIVQQTREADEQQRSVQLRSQKIAEEELQCKAMAEVALAELEEVLPVLEEAVRALDALSKRDLNEIKSYARPPPLVEKVMEAVMLLKCVEPTWAEAKRQLGDPNFITQLRDFDKDHISDKTLKKVGGYVVQPDFDPDMVGKQSLAAKSLCLWVRAIESYGRVYRVVEPKKMRLMSAERILAEKQKNLADAKAKLQELSERLAKLQTEYNEKLAQKEELRIKAESLELKLDRAAKIVSGLAGEKVRWTQTVKDLDENFGYLVGDCLIAAAFVSYMGPFTSNYRDEIVSSIWLPEVRGKLVPCSPTFELCQFLAKPTVVRDWNVQGLPSNPFSVENGIIATRGQRWPLLIDPQGQGLRWIKNMEQKQGLKIIDLQQSNYLSVLERSVTFGHPVLLQNVQETLDASLNPILTKSVIKQGDALYTKIGDKEVEYNPLFRFYISTKLSNPHYPPEIATKTTIINFTVKEDGLEQQLLGIVVRKERPELEEQKDALVTNIAAGKLKLIELEDAVLRLLKTEGSLLEDEALVVTLQSCKTTSADVTEQLETAEETEIKIDAAREAYRPCAKRASILFFVLTDLGKIDPMYQFSLDAYVDLFTHSIDKAQRSPKLENRIQNMNDYHTYAVYKYACRGLFERHKLLFSFHMCIKMLESQSAVNSDEYLFFLKGGVVLDREEQMDNPCPEWLSDSAWDNITELERLANFHGVIQSFEQGHRDWYTWYTSAEPERASLPGEWDTSCSELQRMIFVRSLRPDRVGVCVSTFVVHNLGQRFVEPPVLDFHSVLEDSAAKTPLIFILSPGVDPTTALLQLAEQNDMMDRFYSLSLGQGQAPIATRLLEMGKRNGGWVFLANCHLSLSWMPELDKMVEEFQDGGVHPDFRLWLSSSPHPDFPISILQNGIKITTEPPKGIKANIKRLYQNMTEAQFTACPRQSNYKKLLFSLCFFHSVLLERRKFQQLGWNILYGFNDSDFEVSESLLSIYLREYEDPPWDALKYLIAGVMYGGHVTDDWDRRLLMTYINQMFNADVLNVTYYKLSSLAHYYIPRDGHLSYYQEFSNSLPMVDHPEAFGQHPNADIASSIGDARILFETLLSLQPAVAAAAGGQSSDDKVIGLANDVLTKMPELIDFESTQNILSNDPCPLNVVLLQEIQRYNVLLVIIRRSLEDLKKGIKGLVVMSSDLEEVFVCVLEGRVPPPWLKAYPSMKSLGSWTRDLVQRVEQFSEWSERARPPMAFWLAAFTFPTGFLTAVLQTAARQLHLSVDTLAWEFYVHNQNDSMTPLLPHEGVYICGMYLEGAGWDINKRCLVEAAPMQLVTPMPIVHFKPVENKKKSGKGLYVCPAYYYPNRSGTGHYPSFVVAVDLRCGESPSDHWIRRAAALLLSLSD